MSRPRIWEVWDPKTNRVTRRGPQVTRPREHARAVVVGSYPENDPPPINSSDAHAWDDWRARRGCYGGR